MINKHFEISDRVLNKKTKQKGTVTKITKRDGVHYYLVKYDNGNESAHRAHVLEPILSSLREAPGEVGAALNRFGQRVANATKMAAAGAIGRKAAGAEGKQRTLDTSSRLAQDWSRFSKEQGIQDTFMNMMEFLRTQHGWEPDHNVYSQLAEYMKTGKIDPTAGRSPQSKPEQAQAQPNQAQAQPNQAQPNQEQQQPQAGSTVQPQGTEPKVDTQSQPTQPGTEPEVGDLIQVTINGEDQFQKPRKITKKYNNEWFGVEGSHAGVQRDQITVVQKGEQKPQKPRMRVPAGSSNTTSESYVEMMFKIALMEDTETLFGVPNANAILNRRQIDSLMTIVARDMLRKGQIDYNYDPKLDRHNMGMGYHNAGFVRGPDGHSTIAVNSVRFNTLLGKAGVTQEELYHIQELARRYGNDPKHLAQAITQHSDVNLAKKIMSAAVMSLKAAIPEPSHTNPNTGGH